MENQQIGALITLVGLLIALIGHGWLIGLVVDMNNDTTDAVIIDARQFEQPPVAMIHLPHRVPPGFHGNWIAQGNGQ